MRFLLTVLGLSALCACSSMQDDLRSASGGFVAGGDSYGVTRRPDLHGTQPTTPSIATR